MAKLGLIMTLFVLGLVSVAVSAQGDVPTGPPVLIVEIQTGSLDNSSEEFIELFNTTDDVIVAEDEELKVQYKSAQGSSWQTKASLSGSLEPRGRYLVATPGLVAGPNHESGLGLAKTGGHLRVISGSNDNQIEHDQLSWGNAGFPQTLAAPAPNGGQSLKRMVDEDGNFIDTNDDSQDFIISDTPTPQSTKPLPENKDPSIFQPRQGGDGQVQGEFGNSTGDLKPPADLKISELFIDPDKPLTDAEDEFVEIYNPTKEVVDLEGYTLKTGSSFSYSFGLPDISIKPGQYLALFSIDTGLVLSNTAGSARLVAPAGELVYEVPPYGKAKPDTAWADIGGEWQWTSSPSPNAANSASQADLMGGDEGLNSALNTTAKHATTTDGRTVYHEPPQSDGEVNTAVVAGVGSMALLYVGYEYRYDMGNAVHKLKRYLAARRSGGPKS